MEVYKQVVEWLKEKGLTENEIDQFRRELSRIPVEGFKVVYSKAARPLPYIDLYRANEICGIEIYGLRLGLRQKKNCTWAEANKNAHLYGHRLPTADELRKIWHFGVSFNKAFQILRKYGIDVDLIRRGLTSPRLWSSTEEQSNDQICFVLRRSSLEQRNKTMLASVRYIV